MFALFFDVHQLALVYVLHISLHSNRRIIFL